MNCSSRRWMPRGSWWRMCSISLMGVELKIAVLADEDVEEDPDRWCSSTECGQELWQMACQWVWNEAPLPGTDNAGHPGARHPRGPLPKKLLLFSELQNPHRKSMARGRGPPRSDEPRGSSVQRTRVLQEDGKLRCPAGASLNFGRSASRECLYESEPSTWPIRRIVSPVLCESSVWRKAAKGDRARRGSRDRRLLPPPAPVPVERKPVLLGPIRWVDVAGRALRRTWMTRLSQARRRDPSACRHAAEPFPSPSPTTCGTVASPVERA